MRLASINGQLLDVNENKLKIQFNYESDYVNISEKIVWSSEYITDDNAA